MVKAGPSARRHATGRRNKAQKRRQGVVRKRTLRWLALAVLAVAALASGDPATADDHHRCARTPQANALDVAQGVGLRPLSADYLLDSAGAATPDALDTASFSQAPCLEAFPGPAPGEILWLRFSIVNPTDAPQEWVIDFVETIFGEMSLFERQAGAFVRTTRTGRHLPPAERATATLRALLPVALAPGETRHLYLRAAGVRTPTVTPLLMTERLARTSNDTYMIVSAAFIGFLAAILAVSLLVFRHVEVRFYRYYALYISTLLASSILWDGWLHHLTETTVNVAGWARAFEFLVTVAGLALVQFCRTLLNIDAEHPSWGRAVRFSFVLLSVSGVLAVLDPWALGLPLNVSFVLVQAIMLWGIVLGIRRGVAGARPLAAGSTMLLVGIFASNWFFYTPPGVEDPASGIDFLVLRASDVFFYIAILGESVCMALAISARVGSIQEQGLGAAAEAQHLERRAQNLQRSFDVTLQASRHRIEELESRLIETANGDPLSPAESRFVAWASEQVHARMDDPGFGVRELAAALGTSEKTLGRRLKDAVGMTPVAFIRRERLERARDLILIHQYGTVAETAYAVGFSSTGHFAKLYREAFGESPNAALKAAAKNRS